MKQVFKNQYLKSFKFSSEQERANFISNQNNNKVLSLDNDYGDCYYCYVGYHSLTRKTQFILSFYSYEQEDNLNILFWQENNILILETGKRLYLIDANLAVKTAFDILTPLIGLYITSESNLLLLEEAAFKLINSDGKILKSELFDLIEDFDIKNDQLSIKTSDEYRMIEL